MPTPNRVFAEVAARVGGVDPEDMEAVVEWYESTLPTLPPEQIEQLLAELLDREGLETGPAAPCRYPETAPLPRLDESPPAAEPRLAVLWGALRHHLRRLRGSLRD
jgi:hypothetical protein